MVELFENQLKDFSRQSSKGNQLKWEHDGMICPLSSRQVKYLNGLFCK